MAAPPCMYRTKFNVKIIPGTRFSQFKADVVFQLAFRSVTSSVQTKREQMRRILQLPPPPPPSAPPPASVEEVAPTLPASAAASSEDEERAAAKDVEEAISDYLRRATENFDLTKSVEVSLSYIIPSALQRMGDRLREFRSGKSSRSPGALSNPNHCFCPVFPFSISNE